MLRALYVFLTVITVLAIYQILYIVHVIYINNSVIPLCTTRYVSYCSTCCLTQTDFDERTVNTGQINKVCNVSSQNALTGIWWLYKNSKLFKCVVPLQKQWMQCLFLLLEVSLHSLWQREGYKYSGLNGIIIDTYTHPSLVLQLFSFNQSWTRGLGISPQNLLFKYNYV